VENYGKLAVRLLRRGYEPVVVIGPGERSIADAVCSAAGRSLPVVGEQQDVAGLASVAAGVSVLVGNDSGPMQTAARFGTPVVALFGPTEPCRTGPLGPEHHVLSCRNGLDDRIRSISVDDVEEAATAGGHFANL
jgi:ADP-heptose:LPS heptosyltransferase